MNNQLFFNWSSGKDSALALYYLLRDNKWQIDSLFTTVNAENRRINMHGLHEGLLRQQASSIGIPLKIAYLNPSGEADNYSRLMQEQMSNYKAKGIHHTAFGDIFLEDLKSYREQQLLKAGMKAHFPLWKKDTKKLIHEFLDLGFKAVVVSANSRWFNRDFVGQDLSHQLIDQLPEEVDPCGENGEFHTFCYDGPIFGKQVPFQVNDKQLHDYDNPVDKENKISFWFCDLKLSK